MLYSVRKISLQRDREQLMVSVEQTLLYLHFRNIAHDELQLKMRTFALFSLSPWCIATMSPIWRQPNRLSLPIRASSKQLTCVILLLVSSGRVFCGGRLIWLAPPRCFGWPPRNSDETGKSWPGRRRLPDPESGNRDDLPDLMLAGASEMITFRAWRF